MEQSKSSVEGPGRPDSIAVCQSGARARSRLGARARVGLSHGGPGGRSGVRSGEACLRDWQLFGGWIFGRSGSSLLIISRKS